MVSILFALYMAVLTVMPCSDADGHDHDSASTEWADQHDHSSDQEDDCSPLCFCQCCHVPVMVTSMVYQFQEVRHYNQVAVSYAERSIDSPPEAQFKPPKA